MTQSAFPAVSALVASNRNFFPPPVPPPPPPVLSPFTVKSSISIRLLPPLILRIWNRTLPVMPGVKEAVCRVVELVVTVDPTWENELPPFVLAHSCQVLLPSDPKTACWIVTELAPLKSNCIVTVPVLRIRAH